MSLRRALEGSGPVRGLPVEHVDHEMEIRRDQRMRRLAAATLACPACDAPVALGRSPVTPRDALACPFCDHGAPVRDFLAFGDPSRPARVDLRVVLR
jgi:hypothetical protein